MDLSVPLVLQNLPFWDPLFMGTLGLFALFFITWVVAQRIHNYGVVDVVWGFSLVAMAVWLASKLLLLPHLSPFRVVLVFGLVVLEYSRLGVYIAQRFFNEYPKEDGRYAVCRQVWGAQSAWIMLLAYLLQALLILAMMIPVAFVASRSEESFTRLEWVGLVVWLVGFITELLADNQLKQFKSDSANAGKLCQVGLWARSRHPNYFGQWLQWLAIGIMAFDQSYGWLMAYIPVLMYLFLTQVTGIRITEETMANKYGAAFAAYQSKTNSFFPKLV